MLRPDEVPDVLVGLPFRTSLARFRSVCARCGVAVYFSRSGRRLLKRFPAMELGCHRCVDWPNVDEARVPSATDALSDLGRDN